jgi:hypothetical protein
MGVAEFISNQRKTLRFRLRCPAKVAAGETVLPGHTEDIGSHGCRMVVERRFEPRTPLRIFVDGPHPAPPLTVEALVVWSGIEPACRHGVAFAVADRPAAQRWFDGLAAERPELLFYDRVPDRVELAARVFVAPVPPEPTLAGEDEAAVVRLACSGVTVAELRERLGADWSRAQRALFALLSRGMVTLDQSQAGDPAAWRPLLGGTIHHGPPRRN